MKIFNDGMMAWAAICEACFASRCRSLRKSIIYCLTALKICFWNLGFAAVIDLDKTYFLPKTAKRSRKISGIGLLINLKVCERSPRMGV